MAAVCFFDKGFGTLYTREGGKAGRASLRGRECKAEAERDSGDSNDDLTVHNGLVPVATDPRQ